MSVAYRCQAGVAHLEFAGEGGRLDELLVEDLLAAVARFANDDRARVALLYAASEHFCLGADPNQLGFLYNSDAPRPLVAALENCAKPLVAVLRGAVLGGGLEIALACHYRIAAADARIGLPEIRYGLPPGAGATLRLPRLIGLSAARRLLLSGDCLGATAACELNLLDACIGDDWRAASLDFASRCLAWPLPLPMRLRPLPQDAARFSDWSVATPAQHAVDQVLAHVDDFDAAYALEETLYQACEASRERFVSKGLWQMLDAAAWRRFEEPDPAPFQGCMGLVGADWLDARLVVPPLRRLTTASLYANAWEGCAAVVLECSSLPADSLETLLPLLDAKLPAAIPLLLLLDAEARSFSGSRRLLNVRVYGGKPRYIGQPFPPADADMPVLGEAVKILQALGLVCLHGRGERALGPALMEAVLQDMLSLRQAGVSADALGSVWNEVGLAPQLLEQVLSLASEETSGLPAVPLPPARALRASLLNNAFHCLQGNLELALHPDDIDVLLVEGYGYWHPSGGVMAASLEDPGSIQEDLLLLNAHLGGGGRWQPASFWQRVRG